MKTRETRELKQFLTFDIAGEEYAISVLKVREILEYDVVTPVPNVPASIRGVMNLRGQVVPIIDLAVKFGLPRTQTGRTTCNIVVDVSLEGEDAVMGIMADPVKQVIDLVADEIEPPPAFGTSVHVDYLQGMGKADKRFVLILDLDKLLTTDELLKPEQAEAAMVEVAPTEASEAALP
ncbi:MAG TPA: chemotaxis protein CheW [Thermoanaerobaculia bacterium]|nr:chemotaxis protein CheW [Thermoanaerobaculia bacterium]